MVHREIYLQEKLRDLDRERMHGRQRMQALQVGAEGATGNTAMGVARAALSAFASLFKRDDEILSDETPSGRTQGRVGGRQAAHPERGNASPVLPETAVP